MVTVQGSVVGVFLEVSLVYGLRLVERVTVFAAWSASSLFTYW